MKAFAEAAADSNTAAQTFRRQIVKVEDPDCPHWTNASLIKSKKQRKKNEKQEIVTFEQQRLAQLKAAEQAEADLKKAQQEAIKNEMNSTLSELSTKKHYEWEAKKNNRENLEQSLAMQQEHKQLIEEALRQRALVSLEYK